MMHPLGLILPGSSPELVDQEPTHPGPYRTEPFDQGQFAVPHYLAKYRLSRYEESARDWLKLELEFPYQLLVDPGRLIASLLLHHSFVALRDYVSLNLLSSVNRHTH